MAATSTPDAIPSKPRTRKHHNKVRTGCLTCKIRRKKCDETKPACARCTSTGRKCDGYPGPPNGQNSVCQTSTFLQYSQQVVQYYVLTDGQFKTSKPSKLVKPFQKVEAPQETQYQLYPLPPKQSITDLERHCFTYFQLNTMPILASYFEASIWRSDITRCGFTAHPVLFNVAVALGAVHRRYNYGITPEGFEYCAHADKLYRTAVKALSHQTNPEVIVAGEILLGVFQSFQDDEVASSQHVKNALEQFMSGGGKLIHRETWPTIRASRPRLICRFMHRLYCRAVELLGPIEILQGPVPDRFESLQQMRDYLFTDIDFMMHTCGRTVTDIGERARWKATHEARLEKWSSGFRHLIDEVELTTRNREIFNLLHITRSATYIMIYASFFVDCSMVITKLPVFGGGLVEHWSEDTELGSAAYAVARAAEDIQKYGLNMLAAAKDLIEEVARENGIFRYEEGMAQMLGVYGLAEKVSETEEEAITQAVLDRLPADALRDCVDITCPVESGRILVRYYRPNEFGDGFIWTQEWWSFGGGQYLPSATGF